MSLIRDLTNQIQSLTLKLDRVTDTMNTVVKDVSQIKSRMMEVDMDVKSLKKDVSFTNERIDQITKGDKKYTTLDQSSIYKTLEDNNAKKSA